MTATKLRSLAKRIRERAPHGVYYSPSPGERMRVIGAAYTAEGNLVLRGFGRRLVICRRPEAIEID